VTTVTSAGASSSLFDTGAVGVDSRSRLAPLLQAGHAGARWSRSHASRGRRWRLGGRKHLSRLRERSPRPARRVRARWTAPPSQPSPPAGEGA